MTADEAFKTLTENICQQCAYGAHCMDECDIRGCDNRDAIKVLMSCCNEERKATWSEVIATNVEHDGVIRHFCCSYCGRVVSVLCPQELTLLYPYCHCGAKMEGKDEGI